MLVEGVAEPLAVKFTSRWRWVAFAGSSLFVLVGLSYFTEPFSISGFIVALPCGILGMAGCVTSVLSGVRASQGGIQERDFMGRRRVVKWSNIVGFTIGDGGSKWPSYAPVLRLADGAEQPLMSLSYYGWRGKPKTVSQLEALVNHMIEKRGGRLL